MSQPFFLHPDAEARQAMLDAGKPMRAGKALGVPKAELESARMEQDSNMMVSAESDRISTSGNAAESD